MSKIAKKPILIPQNLELSINENNFITIKGIKGILKTQIDKRISVTIDNNYLIINNMDNMDKNYKIIVGTTSAIIRNMIIGLDKGFSKTLLLVGVGYKFLLENNILQMKIGFSHDVFYTIPKIISINLINQNELVLTSINKEKLGQVAAEIRQKRVPSVYKGKGIRYKDEIIILKEPKKK